MNVPIYVLIGSVALLGGCAVGSDYVEPQLDTANNWVTPQANQQPGEIPSSWWSLLQDKELDSYLALVATNNLDIKVATARVDEAHAARGIARSAFWPQVGLQSSYTRFEQSTESPGAAGSLIIAGLVDRNVDFYNSSLDASWELDLFGGNRRRAEAANAALDANVATRDAVMLSALAETAAAYFELRGAQQRLSIVQSNIETQQGTLDLTKRKIEAGLGRRIDQLRAQAQLDAIKALEPALRAAIRASTYRLGVLTGRRPEEMANEVVAAGRLPDAPKSVPIGLRADLLRRRPDIIIAERQLALATAEVGVAKSEFFPKLVLNGSYGFESDDFSRIGSSSVRTSALIPFVSWPVFQGGRLRASLAAADAGATAAAFSYEKAVLTALADAESAISAYAEELQVHENLSSAAEGSREAAQIAQKLYEIGLADFLTLLDAERRRDETEDQRAQSHTRLLLDLVRVFKSLGGGWSTHCS